MRACTLRYAIPSSRHLSDLQALLYRQVADLPSRNIFPQTRHRQRMPRSSLALASFSPRHLSLPMWPLQTD
jgi:hypothetical protein